MTKTYPIIEILADGVVVTARSTVEAQQAAGDALGGDCTVVSVERVREGGIAGFFATELVRVNARPSRFHVATRELDAAMSSAEELVSSMRANSPQFADRLMSELQLSDTTAHRGEPAAPTAVESSPISPWRSETQTSDAPIVETDGSGAFDSDRFMSERFVSERYESTSDAYVAPRAAVPAATTPSTPAPVARPVTAVERPPIRPVSMTELTHDPRWSHQSLRALGLPDRIVDHALRDQPKEGPEWIVALMGAFRTICASAPAGPTVMAGPSCANLARQLRLVSVDAEELSESFSSVAIPNVTAKTARAAINNRYMHVMVGGRWQHLASIQTHVVSAATPADLLEAVRVCCAWDATLGWSPVGDRYERIDEFTLVAHVRSVLYGMEQTNAELTAGSSEHMMAAFS